MTRIDPVYPFTIRVHPWCKSHALLFFRQSDIHLLQRYFVKRTGYLQPFRLLILPQSIPRRIVKLADLFAPIKTTLLEKRLGLVDLFFIGTKDWASLGALLRGRFACGSGCCLS